MTLSKTLSVALVLLTLLPVVVGAADVPRPAPKLDIRTWDGHQWTLENLKGKVVVVMFMSTNCPHCHAATQALNVIYKESKARGLEVVGIATNRAAQEEVSDFVDRFKPIFPISVGSLPEWAAFGGFSVMARPPYYPHMLFVDRTGTIREEHNGIERNYYSYTNLNRLLEKYLNEPSS